jgi:hypothetical protein
MPMGQNLNRADIRQTMTIGNWKGIILIIRLSDITDMNHNELNKGVKCSHFLTSM